MHKLILALLLCLVPAAVQGADITYKPAPHLSLLLFGKSGVGASFNKDYRGQCQVESFGGQVSMWRYDGGRILFPKIGLSFPNQGMAFSFSPLAIRLFGIGKDSKPAVYVSPTYWFGFSAEHSFDPNRHSVGVQMSWGWN